jgi:hypothetical protein
MRSKSAKRMLGKWINVPKRQDFRFWHKAAVDGESAKGREPTKLRCEIKSEVHASRVSAMGGLRTYGQSLFTGNDPN